MAESVLIFVVDDEHLIAELLRTVLEEGGYEVETADSAKAAMSRLDEAGASFKALVTDVNLGSKLTGWDVAKHAREAAPDIPVVYMSGLADNEWTANGVPYSVMLTKPFPPSQLLTAVSSLLAKGLTH